MSYSRLRRMKRRERKEARREPAEILREPETRRQELPPAVRRRVRRVQPVNRMRSQYGRPDKAVCISAEKGGFR